MAATPTIVDGIHDALEDLGYPELDQDLAKLDQVQFSKLVAWLAAQLNQLLQLDCPVNAIEAGDSDSKAFDIELSSLLRELGSPFDQKQTHDVLHFLCGELMAARIAIAKKRLGPSNSNMDIVVDESETARSLKQAITALGIGRPPTGVTEAQLFGKLLQRLKDKAAADKVPSESALIFEPGFNLTTQQWERLEQFQNSLEADYSLRKKMLITRCDCTVKSFKWKPLAADGAEQKIDQFWDGFLNRIKERPKLSVADAMALRDSDEPVLMNAIVSSHHEQCDIVAPELKGQANAGSQQRESLHRFLIGHVPDRGGRTNEQIVPKKETFAQQSQQRQQGNRGGGGGHRGGHGSNQQGNYREQRRHDGGGGRYDNPKHQPYQQRQDDRGHQQQIYHNSYQHQQQQGYYQQGYQQSQQQYDNYHQGNHYRGGGGGRGRGGGRGGHRQNYY